MNESLTYRLEEMVDAMEESLDNLKRITEQQKLLIKVVEESEESENFKEFIEDSKKQIENFVEQNEKLTLKKQSIEEIVSECKADAKTDSIVTNLLTALGIFQ